MFARFTSLMLWLQLVTLAGVAGYLVWSEFELRQRSQQVTGKLVGFTAPFNSAGARMPVVEYAFGQPPDHYRVEGMFGTFAYRGVGGDVPVLVDPLRPSEGRIATPLQSWGPTLLAVVMGAATAFGLWWRRRRASAGSATHPAYPEPIAGPLPGQAGRAERKPPNRFERWDVRSLIAYLLLALVGVVMAGPGVAGLWEQIRIRWGAVEVVGTVVDHQKSTERGQVRYRLRVEYELPGAYAPSRYYATGRISWSDPFWRGHQLPVHVRPESPREGVVGGFIEGWMFPVLMATIGGSALFVLAWRLRMRWRRAGVARRLRAEGTAIRAGLAGVERRRWLRVNGYSPWVIHAYWWHPSTAVQYRFQSPQLWYDPGPALQRLGYVPMLVKLEDPERFHHFSLDQLE